MISHSKRNYVLVADYPGGNRASSSSGRGGKESRSRSRSGNKKGKEDVVDLTETATKPDQDQDQEDFNPTAQTSSSSSHHVKDNKDVSGGAQKRRKVPFDVTNLTYEQYCRKHYELEMENYHKQRNLFLQNMNNNPYAMQQGYMMPPGPMGGGPMGPGPMGGNFMPAGGPPPLPPGPPPAKPPQ